MQFPSSTVCEVVHFRKLSLRVDGVISHGIVNLLLVDGGDERKLMWFTSYPCSKTYQNFYFEEVFSFLRQK